VSGPPAEPATTSPASWRHVGRSSLPPSVSLVAAAVAPLRSLRVKPAAAYTKNVRRTNDSFRVCTLSMKAPRTRAVSAPDRVVGSIRSIRVSDALSDARDIISL
jgi:hypothetical protein